MNQKITRKLAAIMFTDLSGFTELMQKDEKAGLLVRKRHKDVFEKFHREFNGEIMQYWGDGTLSIFSNSVDAVTCAIGIQKELQNPPVVPLRIGIHSGNIVIEPDGIIGDAVNIASRIESFSVPGAVLVSDAIHDQVKNQPEFGLKSLGKFNLKNVSRDFNLYAIDVKGLIVPEPGSVRGKGEQAVSIGFHYPDPGTPFIGREREVKDLAGLLKTNPVVTITGAGGMGKTRIAVELCHRLEADYPDGVSFTSMEAITDGADLIPLLADALGIKKAEGRTLGDAIASFIYDKKVLLVLDNLEQVISAAPDIAGLIARCPNLGILVTSRTPLRIRAEKEYQLHPLPLPQDEELMSADELMDYPSVALFVGRAKRVNPNFSMIPENALDIVRICRRLDGLPLAIELAASRIRMLAPKALLQKLTHTLDLLTSGGRDMPERHQTLRAAIDWSFNLLTDPEKQLFCRISVFADSFTLEGVEETCYTSHPEEALDHLESLIDKGLVQPVENSGRFKMLQTIKEYSLERQSSLPDKESIQLRHATCYQNYVKRLSDGICSPDQVEWMRTGPAEEANIQVALDHLMVRALAGDANSAESGLNLCGDLFFYWHIRGKHIQGHEYISSFLNSPACPESSPGKCSALLTAGLCSWTLGHFEKSLEEAKKAYELAQVHQLDAEIILSEILLAVGYFGLDTELSLKLSGQGSERARKTANQFLLGQALVFNGIAHLITGQSDRARSRFEEVLAIHKNTKDMESGGLALSNLAVLASLAKNYDESIRLYQESLKCYVSIEDHAEEARVHSEMGWTCLGMKNTKNSRDHFLSSIHLYEKVGSIRGIGLALIGIAAIETSEQRHQLAVQIASAAELFTEQGGIVNVYTDDFPGLLYIEHAKQELNPEELKWSVSEGRKLTVKEALQLSEGIKEMQFTS